MAMKQKRLKKDQPTTIEDDESLGPNGSESSDEEDEMAKRKNEAIQKAFQIPSVVQQIIEGLQDLSDLMACREVSSMWMETTSKLITKRDTCQVFITYDNRIGKFRKLFREIFPRNRVSSSSSSPFHRLLLEPSKCSDAAHHLPALTQLVRKSTHFPCATFGILDGDTRKLEILEFFKVVGGHIKTLKIYGSFTTSTRRFHDILNVHCPNLEKLHVERCYISTINIPCQVPNLKILSINHYHYSREGSPFKMLQCLNFSNLKVIEGFHLPRDLEQVLKAGKIHCVKELDFMVRINNKELDQFKTFVESGPQLENLKLNLCYSFKNCGEKLKWLGLLQKLLNLSQNTLKVFRFRGIESVCRDLHFPKFSRLVEIEIDSSRTTLLVGTNGRYPYEILETHISPNLKMIKGFDMSSDTEAVVGIGRIKCVKELSLYLTGPKEMSKFETLGIKDVFGSIIFPQFPQLREIEIYSWSAVEEGMRYPYEILRDDISPNLKVIKGFNLPRDTQEVVRAGKINCVKQLDFNYEGLELEPVRLFLSAHPQLETLDLYRLRYLKTNDLDWRRELTGLLEQLLELSKDTLNIFEFYGVGAIFENMKFPKFSHLFVAGEPDRMFPRGINLIETFPVLEILDLHECSSFDGDESWDSYFPPPDAYTGSLTSVKTLTIHQGLTLAGKRNVRMICPNGKVVSAYLRDEDSD